MSEVAYKGTVTRHKIMSMMKEGVKSVSIRDGAGRTESLYEAPLHAVLNDPCLLTQFKYSDGATGSSRIVIATKESITGWPTFEALQIGAGNDFDSLA